MSFTTTAALRLLAFLTLGIGIITAQPVTTRTDDVAKQLNEWFVNGTAAGLKAITYENRDGQHSPLNTAQYPLLQVFKGTETDKGAATQVRNTPTLGNCSMASGADQLGCLPRLYMMDPGGNRFLAQQYLSNNLFIYPEHQDHDIGGYGDRLPLNTPCLLISQGSSFTDQPFLQALVAQLFQRRAARIEAQGLVDGLLRRADRRHQCAGARPPAARAPGLIRDRGRRRARRRRILTRGPASPARSAGPSPAARAYPASR